MGITEYLKENLNESRNPNRTQKGIDVVIKNITTKLRSGLGEKVKVLGNRISVDLKRYREYGKSDGFIKDKFAGILERMYTDLDDFIQISVEKNQVVIIVSPINESSIDESEFKIGDYVTKTVNKGGGHKSVSQGWIISKTGGSLFQIGDEWGGYTKGKWHNPKGFKLKKRKSKEVTKHKPLMDLIKELGGNISESGSKTQVYEIMVGGKWKKVRATSMKSISKYEKDNKDVTDWRMVGMMSRAETKESQKLEVVG